MSTAKPGAHICLKCADMFTRDRCDCERNLQQDEGSCSKKSCRCTSYKFPRTSKSGVLEKTTCHHCSILRSLMSKRPWQVSPFWAAAQSTNSTVFDFQIQCSPHVLLMNSQLLFADSLTSTLLLQWSSSGVPEEHRSPRAYFSTCLLDTVPALGSIPHRSPRACPATLSLDTVEDVMVGEEDAG